MPPAFQAASHARLLSGWSAGRLRCRTDRRQDHQAHIRRTVQDKAPDRATTRPVRPVCDSRGKIPIRQPERTADISAGRPDSS